MNDEVRQSRNIKIKPSILRKVHHSAIESQKRVGEWVEEAIEEKIKREERSLNRKDLWQQVSSKSN